jgi:hypothetical protein
MGSQAPCCEMYTRWHRNARGAWQRDSCTLAAPLVCRRETMP